MADFLRALPFVLKHEGGWSDDPADPGGATNFGITLAVAQHHGIMTKDALHAITPDQVSSIYRADYWHFDAVEDQRVATKLFDLVVNMGLGGAVRLAQMAMNTCGACLTVDGGWGPRTLACLNTMAPDRMLTLLCAAAAARYQDIVDHRPASSKFLRGWLARAAEVPNA